MSEVDEPSEGTVFVVDDDASMRLALANLFSAVGLRVECFGSAETFLGRMPVDTPSCLILDVRLPGVSGLKFQDELARADLHIPIIFITAHGDIPMSVRAMKAGAFEFLTKPFRDQELLDATQLALKQDRLRLEHDRDSTALHANFDTLTPREREIMGHVTAGLMNKQIAAQMGLAEITVKIHRGHVMQKMGARSLADLVKMGQAIGVDEPHP
jgi:FixJ family two-component response regulator